MEILLGVSSFLSSFAGKTEGRVLERERFARGGGILGNSPSKVAEEGVLELDVFASFD